MKQKIILAFLLFIGGVNASERTTHTVWTIHESTNILSYTVTPPGVAGGNWTWKYEKEIYKTQCPKPRAACPGNNVVYVADDSGKIVKYSTDGAYDSTVATGLPQPQSICLSPDGQYLYLCSMKSGYEGVYRYPLNNISSGGRYIGSDAVYQPRQIFFGEDGLLYVCSRNSQPNSGVKSFDCSDDEPKLSTFYAPIYGNKKYSNDGSCCLDIANKRLVMQCATANNATVALVFDYVSPENATGGTVNPCDSKESSLGTSFGSICLDGDWFAADYYNKAVVQMAADGSFAGTPFVTGQEKLRSFVDVTAAINTSLDGKLKAKWKFDESSSASIFRVTSGTEIGKYDVYPRRWVLGGAKGVLGNCLWFDTDDSRLEFLDSTAMVPDTGDFSIVLWVGFPEFLTRTRNILNNNDNRDGRFSMQVTSGGKPKVFIGYKEENIELTGETNVSDGKWHQLAFVRRDGKAELWVDGEQKASADFAKTSKIANSCNWVSGQIAVNNNEKTGKMFLDDMAIYSAALSASDIKNIYSEIAPNGSASIEVPTAPSRPSENLSACSRYGTIVEHVNALDGRIGAPALHVDADGTYWIAHDYGRESLKPDNETVVMKSTDKGMTWKVVATNGMVAASFVPNGKLAPAMMGLKNGNEKKILFATTSNAGNTWNSSELSINDSVGSWHPQIPASRNGAWHISAENGWVSFSVSEGVANDLSYGTYAIPGAFKGEGYSGTRAGMFVLRPDASALDVFLPESPSEDYRYAAESIMKLRVGDEGKKMLSRAPFPGGMKPFSIAYDKVSKTWWAAVTPVRPAKYTSGTSPVFQHRALSLYASRNLDSWRFVTDEFADAGDSAGAAFNDPAIAFDGNDMVLAFGLSAPDGDVGPRSSEESNYLMIRKIPGFRTLEWKDDTRTVIYATHNSAAYVGKYVFCEETGELLDDGVFAQGSFGGKELVSLNGLAVTKDRLFVSSASSSCPCIWEFDRESGDFVRILEIAGECLDEIAVSPDGGSLFASASSSYGNCIYRFNLADGKPSLYLASKSQDGWVDTCRAMLPLKDGSLVFANRVKVENGGGVFRADASGNLLEKLCDGDRIQAMYRSKDGVYHMAAIEPSKYMTLKNGELITQCSNLNAGYVFSIFPVGDLGKVLFASVYNNPSSLGCISDRGFELRYPGTKNMGCAASWTIGYGTVIVFR